MCDRSSESITQTIIREMSRYDRPEGCKAFTWSVPQQQKTERNCEKCNHLLKNHVSQVKSVDNYVDVSSMEKCFSTHKKSLGKTGFPFSLSLFLFLSFGKKKICFQIVSDSSSNFPFSHFFPFFFIQ